MTGACQAGTSNSACGFAGVTCQVCTGATTCLAGTCQSASSDGGFNLELSSPGTFASCPSSPCGVERWSIKTTTDSAAPQISTNVQTTTVAALIQLPTEAVGSSDARGGPSGTWAPECQTYYVKNATLTRIIAESDEDYHLVLQDPTTTTSTMIGEIPCPSWTSGAKPSATSRTPRGAGGQVRLSAHAERNLGRLGHRDRNVRPAPWPDGPGGPTTSKLTP